MIAWPNQLDLFCSGASRSDRSNQVALEAVDEHLCIVYAVTKFCPILHRPHRIHD
jgi:hypothetical protein